MNKEIEGTEEEFKDMSVMFRTDESGFDPCELGDFMICADVATWLLNTYHSAHQDWLEGSQEYTVDALSTSLTRMHPTVLQLAHFRRLLCNMDLLIKYRQDEGNASTAQAGAITTQVVQRKNGKKSS